MDILPPELTELRGTGSSPELQMPEMIINCELAEAGRDMGCQMMVEGPGHVPLDEIKANILLEKRMSGGAPYLCWGRFPLTAAPAMTT